MKTNFKRIVSLARKRTKNPEKEKEYLQEILPNFSVTLSEDGKPIDGLANLFSKIYQEFILEIGFGSGENILFNAKNNPNIGYIGCEVFNSGVVKLLEDVKLDNIENIRIWHNDALELIPELPNNSLKLVYILHPDPWPKRKHNNRRLINEEFLRLIATKIAVDGEVLIITDHADYAKSIARTITSIKDIFNFKNSSYPPITKTKYRLKADALGNESKYFCLVKKDNSLKQ